MPLVSTDALDQTFDVCIVGAGPAGLACAFNCHERGLRVLLLEAGARRPIPGTPDILAAEIANPEAHDPVEIVSAAALGGTSHWWGGRCVPLDASDFKEWPVSWEEMLPWWRYAAELAGGAGVLRQPAPGKFANLTRFDATPMESWTSRRVFANSWRSRIMAKDGPAILLRVRVIGLHRAGGEITRLELLTPSGPRTVQAANFVLAGGGLGTLRLMLVAQQKDPGLFGGPNGPLGRGYMGHLTGSIANLAFNDTSDQIAFNFARLTNRGLTRRRIQPRATAIEEQGICNVAFWLDHPAGHAASHGSAAVSARYLAATGIRILAGGLTLKEVPPLSLHLNNVSKRPLDAIGGLGHAAWMLTGARATRHRIVPRGFLPARQSAWRLIYHAEQKRDPSNRITLSAGTDSICMPKLKIDFQFSRADADAVVQVHNALDEDLRSSGAGSLMWTANNRQAAVRAMARDGYHQLGGAVMSDNPETGVVDRHCRVHALENLWVVSGSVFPSGGQANPTLTIIALACRVADNIALRRSRKGRAPPSLVVSSNVS